MAKYIQNLTFQVLSNFLSMSPTGWFLLVSRRMAFLLFITITDSRKYANKLHFYPHYEDA
jgi:hypothetical protein